MRFMRCCKWWESWVVYSCFQNVIIFTPQRCYYSSQVCFWSNGFSNSAYKVPVIRIWNHACTELSGKIRVNVTYVIKTHIYVTKYLHFEIIADLATEQISKQLVIHPVTCQNVHWMHTLFCVNTTFDVTKVIPQLYHLYQHWNGTREKLYKMSNYSVVSKYHSILGWSTPQGIFVCILLTT